MDTHSHKTQKNKKQAAANNPSLQQGIRDSSFQFIDNRPEAVAQRKLQRVMHTSQKMLQLSALQQMASNNSRSPIVQRAEKEVYSGLIKAHSVPGPGLFWNAHQHQGAKMEVAQNHAFDGRAF